MLKRPAINSNVTESKMPGGGILIGFMKEADNADQSQKRTAQYANEMHYGTQGKLLIGQNIAKPNLQAEHPLDSSNNPGKSSQFLKRSNRKD